MDLTRTFLILFLFSKRISDSIFPDVLLDVYPTHDVQYTCIAAKPVMSFGQLAFYQNFVTSYSSVPKKKSFSTYRYTNSSHSMPYLLLLCGDIHPCPGPSTPISRFGQSSSVSSTDTSSSFKQFKQRGLHFIHLNVRSLLPKIDEIRLLSTRTNAACIMITETWLDDTVSDSEIHINNYSVRRKDRNRQGGGVCFFIRNNLTFNARNDLDHPELEASWIELLLPKSKPILCGVLYRPPNQMNFYELLENLFTSNSHFNEYETLMLGDFNTNVSKTCKCALVKNLTAFIELFNFSQLIHDFTRICNTSSSTIDLILVSDSDKISQSGVVDVCISDHSLIFCTRKVTKLHIGNHNNIKVRSLKNYNKDDFQQSLLNADWSSVLICDNVSEAWNNFKLVFLSVIDSIAPVREIRVKQRTEPWINSDILQCINERNKAFNVYKRTRSDEHFNAFKVLRNKAQSAIFKAKKNYFTEKLEHNKNDSKTLWKTLRELGLPSKKGKSSGSSLGLKIDGEISFDKLNVAEKFNSFYTSIASSLVEKLPQCVNKYGKSFVSTFYSSKGILPNSFSFSIVSENRILKYLNNLSANKATGLDGIPSRFIKDGASIIASPLTHVINLSIIQGSVPDDLKLARVIPLFKKNDKTEVSNYRPVSILCILSKVFEKVIFDQVEEYLNDKNLLYNFQSGFRRGFSTDTCLIHLSDFIRLQMDKGNMVGMVLLDLQKAFDTVDHNILLMKL